MDTRKIRQLLESDMAQCCAIINACVQEMDDLNQAARDFIIAKNSPERLFRELSAGYSLVCVDREKIIGLGCLDGQELKRMYIHPASQGTGAGHALLQALEQEAVHRGIEKLLIQSSLSAQGFYGQHGYCILQDEVIDIGEASFRVITMEKQLLHCHNKHQT